MKESESRKTSKNGGITLIVLIITIIIMLILVAVSVDLAMDGKLFDKAKGAVQKTNNKVEQTQNRVDDLMDELDDASVIDGEAIPIYTKEQLALIGSGEKLTIEEDDKNRYLFKADAEYVLQNDIDLSGTEWTPLPSFSGIFDGNNHAINGLTINDPELYLAGFWSEIHGGTIKNLALTNVNIVAARNVGGICASLMDNAIIENCFVTGTFSILGYGGGIAAVIGNDSIIRNCYTTCEINSSITGSIWATNGGIAGYSAWIDSAGKIENCYSTSKINALNPYNASIMSYNEYEGNVKNCYALSSSIDGGYLARVSWNNKGINNYGYAGMLLNNATVTSTDATSSQGADITLAEATSQAHYVTKGKWGFDANGPWTFNYTGMNVGAGTNLPILKSFKTVLQNPKIQ